MPASWPFRQSPRASNAASLWRTGSACDGEWGLAFKSRTTQSAQWDETRIIQRGGSHASSTASHQRTIESSTESDWIFRVGSNLLIGRKPDLRDLQAIHAAGVTSIVSVVLPHEYVVSPDKLQRLGFKHFEITVKEGEALTIDQLISGINFIAQCEARGETVFAHCRIGQVRCVMLATAYAIVSQGLSVESAAEDVLKKVPHSKLRRKHRVNLELLHKMCESAQAQHNEVALSLNQGMHYSPSPAWSDSGSHKSQIVASPGASLGAPLRRSDSGRGQRKDHRTGYKKPISMGGGWGSGGEFMMRECVVVKRDDEHGARSQTRCGLQAQRGLRGGEGGKMTSSKPVPAETDILSAFM